MSLVTESPCPAQRARGTISTRRRRLRSQALLRVEQLPHRLWEPAAGRGNIVNVLRAAGHEVIGAIWSITASPPTSLAATS